MISKNIAQLRGENYPEKQAVAIAENKARSDSSAVAALDPAKLDACFKAADALATLMDAMCGRRDSLDGKFQHHKGKDNVRPDATSKTISVSNLNQSYDMLFQSVNLWLPVQKVEFHMGAKGEKHFVRVTCSQGAWYFPDTANVQVRKR